MLTKTGVVAFVFAVCVSTAFAEENLGVAVYPGAHYDQERTMLLRESLFAEGAAYRTGDAIESVTAFYRKQGLLYLNTGGSASGIARFKAHSGADVLIQSPWKDRHGVVMHDTLIMIFKKEAQGSGYPGMSI